MEELIAVLQDYEGKQEMKAYPEPEFLPGTYAIVQTAQERTTVERNNRHGKDMKLYSPGDVVEIIQVKEILREKRIRGQIKETLNWISLKHTKHGKSWVSRMNNEVSIDAYKP